MRFDDLLSRADDEMLQTMLGGAVLRLLGLLDSSLITPSSLRELLIGLRTRVGLLTDRECRALLVDLLRPAEAERLALVLGLTAKADVYNALRTLTVHRRSPREQLLFDFFELVPPAIEQQDEIPSTRTASVRLALFKHQRDAARKVKRALSQEPRRVLLHMPTGAGKTRTAMQIIADHLRASEPTLVIWLAYSEELCEQAASEFEQTWQSLGDRDVKIHRFWGSHSLDLDQASDGIVVASLTKLYRATMGSLQVIGTLASRCSLVVIDEAHQAIAETYRLVLDALVIPGRTSALLGLTATPGRTWDDIGADEKLADFFARGKVTLQVAGYANPVDYLIDQGYLARVDFKPLLHQGGLHLSDADLKRIQTELDVPLNVLKRLAEDEQRNLAIVMKVEELAQRHARLMVFAASVQHAQLLAAVLRARGFAAAAVTADTPTGERSQLLERYKNDTGNLKILCNFGVLTTGFDAPRTSAAVIARPTRSLVLYSQMIGRAIRGPQVGGNPTAEIVTVIDRDLPGFGSVAQAFTNWEDVWSEL